MNDPEELSNNRFLQSASPKTLTCPMWFATGGRSLAEILVEGSWTRPAKTKYSANAPVSITQANRTWRVVCTDLPRRDCFGDGLLNSGAGLVSALDMIPPLQILDTEHLIFPPGQTAWPHFPVPDDHQRESLRQASLIERFQPCTTGRHVSHPTIDLVSVAQRDDRRAVG